MTTSINPKYKIEVYHGASLIYTITDEAISIYTKEVITEGVGHFQFSVPTVKGVVASGYRYNDIVPYDKVKIYFGYGTVGANPDFVGRISTINAPLSTKTGYIRIFSGFSVGEILLRRLKENKIWNNVDACNGAGTPIYDITNDLGIYHAADVDTVTDNVTIQVDGENYFDILRKVSDYWVSAGTQIKQDFHVATDEHLHWKARPWRTSGVDTFIVGQNIAQYSVIRNDDVVRNNITVYGEQGKVGIPGMNGRTEPTDMDSWTVDSLDNWNTVHGTESIQVPGQVGANYLRVVSADTGGGNYEAETGRDISTTVVGFGKGAYQTVNFWNTDMNRSLNNYVWLFAPDSSNYFQATVGIHAAFTWHSFQLGENQEYDATKNPSGVWTKIGSPNWSMLHDIFFHADSNDANLTLYIDGVYFGHGRWRYTASDSTSQTDYGQRDVDYIFDNLTSDAQCEARAKTLLYQLKDLPIQVIATRPGSTNTLVGDRVPMTIPAEGISAANYDIIAVENSFTTQGWLTKATMVNSANTRTTIPTNIMDKVRTHDRLIRELGRLDRKLT